MKMATKKVSPHEERDDLLPQEVTVEPPHVSDTRKSWIWPRIDLGYYIRYSTSSSPIRS